jgi:hypothetical protein
MSSTRRSSSIGAVPELGFNRWNGCDCFLKVESEVDVSRIHERTHRLVSFRRHRIAAIEDRLRATHERAVIRVRLVRADDTDPASLGSRGSGWSVIIMPVLAADSSSSAPTEAMISRGRLPASSSASIWKSLVRRHLKQRRRRRGETVIGAPLQETPRAVDQRGPEATLTPAASDTPAHRQRVQAADPWPTGRARCLRALRLRQLDRGRLDALDRDLADHNVVLDDDGVLARRPQLPEESIVGVVRTRYIDALGQRRIDPQRRVRRGAGQ